MYYAEIEIDDLLELSLFGKRRWKQYHDTAQPQPQSLPKPQQEEVGWDTVITKKPPPPPTHYKL